MLLSCRFDAAWLKAVQNIDSSHLADAAADRNRLSETIENRPQGSRPAGPGPG